MKKILLLLFSVLLVCGCSKESDNITAATKISYENAKEKIQNGAILVDVRTKDEYEEGHIEGAILLPHNEITKASVTQKIENQNMVIIVYCRSGNRSEQAGITLKKLGYTQVYDLGSINNWKE